MLQLKIEGDEIRAARFAGQGCSISQASVSMMTVLLEGRKLADAEGLADRFTGMMRGDESASGDRALGDLRALQGVSKFPVRIKCALLGFDALLEALKQSGYTPAIPRRGSRSGERTLSGVPVWYESLTHDTLGVVSVWATEAGIRRLDFHSDASEASPGEALSAGAPPQHLARALTAVRDYLTGKLRTLISPST